jgi:hypothetical protein
LKLRSCTPNLYPIPQLNTRFEETRKKSSNQGVNLDREKRTYKLGVDNVVAMSSCRHLSKSERKERSEKPKLKFEKWRRGSEGKGKTSGRREAFVKHLFSRFLFYFLAHRI